MTAHVSIGSTLMAKSRSRFSLNSAKAKWRSRRTTENHAELSIAAETSPIEHGGRELRFNPNSTLRAPRLCDLMALIVWSADDAALLAPVTVLQRATVLSEVRAIPHHRRLA